MDFQSSGSETVERAMPDADVVLLKRARSPSPEAEEENKLAIVVVPQQLRPKRSTKLPAKLRDSPAHVTPPSRGSEVIHSKPCMADTPAVEGGFTGGSKEGWEEGENGEDQSGRLVAVPVMLSENWTEAEGTKLKQTKSKAAKYQRGLGRKGDNQEKEEGGQSVEGQSQVFVQGRKEEGGVGSVIWKQREKEAGVDSRGKTVGPVVSGPGGASSVADVGSPSKIKPKGKKTVGSPSKAFALGLIGPTKDPSGCGAPEVAEGVQEVGADLGGAERLGGVPVGGRKGGGASVSPLKMGTVRGGSREGKGKEEVMGGQGAREGRGKDRQDKGRTGLSGGVKGVESPVGRERTRSPVRGRGGGSGGKAVAAGHRGKNIRQPQFDHGTLVTTIQQVVTQLADDEVVEVAIRRDEEGEWGQASPGKLCDK